MYTREDHEVALKEFAIVLKGKASAEARCLKLKMKLNEARAVAVQAGVGLGRNEMIREGNMMYQTLEQEVELNTAQGLLLEAEANYELVKYKLDLMLSYGGRYNE